MMFRNTPVAARAGRRALRDARSPRSPCPRPVLPPKATAAAQTASPRAPACRRTSSIGSCWATSRCSAASRPLPRARTSTPPSRPATPRLARRAAEVALAARLRRVAEQAAKLWADLDPAAERPKQILAGDGLRAPRRGSRRKARESELRTRLERFLADAALSGSGVGEPFLQLNRVFAQQSDKTSVFRLIGELAKPYPTSAEAHFADRPRRTEYRPDRRRDRAAESMAAVDRALALKPDWDRAVLLKAELTAKRSGDEAFAFSSPKCARRPSRGRCAARSAQFLTEQKRYGEAREIYRKLLGERPGSSASCSSALPCSRCR